MGASWIYSLNFGEEEKGGEKGEEDEEEKEEKKRKRRPRSTEH